MNINEIYEQLDLCLAKLDEKEIDDEAKLDLELLAIQLKRQIRLSVFDPLKDIDSVTIADMSKLSQLVAEVNVEIQDEQKRVRLVGKIINLTKIGLKAAGLPIPS